MSGAQRRRLPSPLALGVCFEAPLFVIGFTVWRCLWGSPRAFGDFLIFRRAGIAVVHGLSPYVAPIPQLVAQNDKFVYPAPMALLFAPFALLPLPAAKVVYLACSIGAIFVGLRLLGVKDLRCYGVALLGAATVDCFNVGSFGPFLFLGLAVSWHSRETVKRTGVAVGLTALSKLLLWPLLVWLVATRRYRAAGLALVSAALTAVLGWAVIGFAGFRDYPALVKTLSDVMVGSAYSVPAFALSLGAPRVMASGLDLLLPLVGIVLIAVLARRPDGDRKAFSAAVATALLALPILWLHYLILLLAPIALARPRLSPMWFAPLVFWGSSHFESQGVTWRIVLVLAATAAILTRAIVSTRAHASTDLARPASFQEA